jgi:hypothetical protein
MTQLTWNDSLAASCVSCWVCSFLCLKSLNTFQDSTLFDDLISLQSRPLQVSLMNLLNRRKFSIDSILTPSKKNKKIKLEFFFNAKKRIYTVLNQQLHKKISCSSTTIYLFDRLISNWFVNSLNRIYLFLFVKTVWSFFSFVIEERKSKSKPIDWWREPSAIYSITVLYLVITGDATSNNQQDEQIIW